METVFDALKAMGKATSIELAARLDIGNAPSCCARFYFTTSGLRWSRLYPYSESLC